MGFIIYRVLLKFVLVVPISYFSCVSMYNRIGIFHYFAVHLAQIVIFLALSNNDGWLTVVMMMRLLCICFVLESGRKPSKITSRW